MREDVHRRVVVYARLEGELLRGADDIRNHKHAGDDLADTADIMHAAAAALGERAFEWGAPKLRAHVRQVRPRSWTIVSQEGNQLTTDAAGEDPAWENAQSFQPFQGFKEGRFSYRSSDQLEAIGFCEQINTAGVEVRVPEIEVAVDVDEGPYCFCGHPEPSHIEQDGKPWCTGCADCDCGDEDCPEPEHAFEVAAA